MRIGPAREPFQQQMSLHDYCGDAGTGIVGFHSMSQLPQELVDFVYTQYERFNIPVLERKHMDEVIRTGAWASYYLLDIMDPYLWLAGSISDVTWSDLGHTHTIEVKDPWKKKTYEADPEQTEVFVRVPGQGEAFFQEYLAKPGLAALPYDLGEAIDMNLFDYYGGPEEYCDADAISELQKICLDDDGSLNKERYYAYFELSAWASFLWFVGPLARDWRISNHDAFWLCETQGRAIIHGMTFYSEEYYTIKERTPQSCCICGLDSYCVELSYVEGMNRFVCEHHLNGPAPLYEGATCGTKACKFVACMHHPMHGQADAMHRLLTGTGQFTRLIAQKHVEKGLPPPVQQPVARLVGNN